MKERKVRYLCPCCFEDSGINLIKYPEVKFKDGEHYTVPHYDKLVTIVEPWITFKAECKKCKMYVEFIDIDEGFVELIQYLNSGPYNTMFCCEGHERTKERYDHPYLTFTCGWDDRTYAKMLKELPESWEMFKIPVMDVDEYRNKYFNLLTEIRLYCRNFYKYPDCMEDLKEYIYKWFPYLEEKEE